MSASSVDLPHPLGPMIATLVPASMSAVTSSTARTTPADVRYSFETDSSVMFAGVLTAPDLAVVDSEAMLGPRGELVVVRDEQHGESAIALCVEDHLHHLIRARGVELARHLVGEEEVRVVGEGDRDGDALALAAGEPAGEVVEPVRETELVEQVLGAVVAGLVAAEIQGELDVLAGGEERDQVAALQHDPDAVGAQPGARGVVQPGDVVAVEVDRARVGHHEPRDEPEQRGLPAAGRTGEARRGAALDREGRGPEHGCVDAAFAVRLRDRVDVHQRGCHPPQSVRLAACD